MRCMRRCPDGLLTTFTNPADSGQTLPAKRVVLTALGPAVLLSPCEPGESKTAAAGGVWRIAVDDAGTAMLASQPVSVQSYKSLDAVTPNLAYTQSYTDHEIILGVVLSDKPVNQAFVDVQVNVAVETTVLEINGTGGTVDSLRLNNWTEENAMPRLASVVVLDDEGTTMSDTLVRVLLDSGDWMIQVDASGATAMTQRLVRVTLRRW